MNALEQDFDLKFGVPGGMATYRKSLALGFFYRFYHEILSEIAAEDMQVEDKDLIPEIERAISTGKEDHDAAIAYEQKILGKAKNHVAALKQTTGEAQYTDDIPVHKNGLFGCLVLSTKPRAKIISIDYSEALEIPGVVDFVDHRDLPNPAANYWGIPRDESFLAVDEVYTAGQPIAMVMATSALQATAGARAVKITYEELPAIFTIEEAIEKKSFFNHTPFIKKGDVEEGFAKSDFVFTGSARMGGQEHFYLETNACVAIPKPEDGEMEIWASTQNPNER